MNCYVSINHTGNKRQDPDWLLKSISQSLGSKKSVKIKKDNAGKPWLISPKGYFISGSHSGSKTMVAIHNKPVGVDIELNKKRIPELLIASTDKQERMSLKVHGINSILAAWTAKEAAQKSDTKIHNMNDYKITVNKNEPSEFIINRGSFVWHGTWWFKKTYICCVAIRQ